MRCHPTDPPPGQARIVAVAGDPGGAAALGPVLAELAGRAEVRVQALAYRQARSVWKRQGLAYQELPESLTPAAADKLLAHPQAALLLTGTSVNGVDLEKKFFAAARQRQVPSLAVLDFWSNYRRRFADGNGPLPPVPDRIAVMDQRARDEMIAAGFEAARLCVTGQPAFDALPACRANFTSARRAALRRRWGASGEDAVVLFASQPLASLYGSTPDNPRYLGYCEHSVLEALIRALERIAPRCGRAILLVIRPHPREKRADLERHCSSSIRVRVEDAGEAREAALAADLVAGMTTVLLLEAALMGCAAVSLQPGLRGADQLACEQGGLIVPVYRNELIEPVLQGLLCNETLRRQSSQRAAQALQPGAAGRVVQLVLEMLQTRTVSLMQEQRAE